MKEVRLDRDLEPVTAFRANVAARIARVRASGRPLVLTQHGRGAVVIVDVADYERALQAEKRAGEKRELEPPPQADAVEAYKPDVDRGLLRENLALTVTERIQRLQEMAAFAAKLRSARRRRSGAPARRDG